MLSITLNPISKTLLNLSELSLCLSHSLATSIANETHHLVEDVLGGHQSLIVLHRVLVGVRGGGLLETNPTFNVFTNQPREERREP